MHFVCDGEELLEPSDEDVFRGVGKLFIIVSEHLSSRIDKEESEESQYPFKLLYHSGTGKDEDTPQYKGSEDAPEEYFMLVFAFYTKKSEEHQEDEEIIH